MKTLRSISEDDMVAAFLLCELGSPRFRGDALRALEKEGTSLAIIEAPELDDDGQNATRKRLLGQLRGFQRNTALFRRFPVDVLWERALITRAELSQVRYIDYDYWLELSGGSRRPADGARRIREGVDVFGQGTASFWNAVGALRSGVAFLPLILVTPDRERFVVIDGHVRLTAFALAPELTPDKQEVIIGSSSNMPDWPLY